MARQKGYSESAARNYARVEKDAELGDNSGIFNVASNGPATYVQTPDTPDNYNRANAWNDDQATHYNEAEYEAETANPAGYQVTLGA